MGSAREAPRVEPTPLEVFGRAFGECCVGGNDTTTPPLIGLRPELASEPCGEPCVSHSRPEGVDLGCGACEGFVCESVAVCLPDRVHEKRRLLGRNQLVGESVRCPASVPIGPQPQYARSITAVAPLA